MVTSAESFLCCVLNEATEDHWAFLLGTESTVQDLYDQVASRCERNEYSFKLRCDEQGSLIPNSINLHNKKAKKLKDVGFQPLVKNQITLAMKEAKEVVREDVGSACSDAPLSPPPDPPPPPPTSAPSSSTLPALTYDEPSSSVPVPFVGLVNQAMTCYLNSLLQALFMTPEFRNALYHWKYDGSQGSELPLELQKLFLKLQTSKRQSVETTALTKSFGWNSSEAWTQHDIQELCRLLFDALERQFKGTDQADLINRLYEGTMLDYVRCLECSTERHREDKFLDIPLPVRPFGSTAAYNSVEEALRAFVQPETLEGNNQYHCEKCNKKCDAHKGLKFTHFPYLLTLHLKRFDFDYNTLNRIKLNDKVTFPYTLNLNGFVKKTNGDGAGDTAEETVKYDDCSTTDSGSALDEDNADASAPAPVPQPIHTNHVDIQEEDEGIDVSNTAESEKNRANASEPGPYMYDLFSIMIHSGSASGGHYYAYIKDYTTGGWFCFNDHSVSRIKEEDIERTYGGGSRYSSLCYSSTNAYMLMYRQIDPKRNVTAMSEDQFPSHLHEQLKIIEEQKAIQQRIQQSERDMMRIKCYYKSPEDEKVKMYRLSFHKNTPLRSALIEARQSAGVDDSVPTEQCRLVSYDSVKQLIECSFEGRENETVSDLSMDCYKDRDWLLQVRAPEEVFTVHRFGDITTRIMVIDPTSRDLDGPFIVATNENSDLRKFREQVASVLRFDPASTQLFSSTYSLEVEALTDDFKTLKELRVINKERIYVYNGPVTNPLSIDQAVLNALNIINLHINLPLVTEEILQELNIPGGLPEECAAARAPSPQVLPDVGVESTFPTTNEDLLTGAYSDQSASEDSSLTDSERTIIGDAPSSPDNMSPQVSPLFGRRAPSPNETFSYGSMALDRISRRVDSDEENDCHFFKVKSSPDPKAPFPRILEVLVDKRMCMTEIKKQLERHVGVRTDYFKMFLQVSGSETEMSRTEHPLKTAHDDAVINVRLGRAPRKGELSGKVYLLDLNKDEPEKYLFDWLIAEGAAVSAVKREMLDEARRRSGLDIPYNRCRLRQKKYKIPEQPYIDSSHIKDIQSNWEMYIQELEGDEPMSDPLEQRLVFARQWCPSTTELKPFSEFLLTSDTVSELGQKISDKCGIPVEKIQIAYGTVTFPCKLTPRDIHSDLIWKTVSQDSGVKLKIYPFHLRDNSGVVFFRDSREEFKAPSHEILKDQASDDWRKKPTYQRREKALRICAEVPKKDSDVE